MISIIGNLIVAILAICSFALCLILLYVLFKIISLLIRQEIEDYDERAEDRKNKNHLKD